MLIMPSFKKSLIVEQFQRNYFNEQKHLHTLHACHSCHAQNKEKTNKENNNNKVEIKIR